MNWKKGLIRLWVVLSLIWTAPWLGFVVFDIGGDISEFKASIDAIDQKTHSLKVREYFGDKRKGEISDFCLRMELGNTRETVEVCNSELAEKMLDDSAVAMALKTKIESRISSKREHQNKIIPIALLPPLILLIIGAGLYWAFSGFRQKQ